VRPLWPSHTHMRLVTFAAAILLIATLAARPLQASPAAPPEPPEIAPAAGGIRITWQAETGAVPSKQLPTWTEATVGGYQVPAQLVAVRLDESPAAPRVERLESVPWTGALPTPAEQLPPRTAPDAEERPALQMEVSTVPCGALQPDAGSVICNLQSALPSPVVVLREARVRGVHLALLAITPVFVKEGALHAVTELEATLPGAKLLDADMSGLFAETGPFLASAPAPTNPAAAQRAWTIRVTQAGIQQLTGADLAAAGVPLGDTPRLQVHRAGREIALDMRDGGDGRLDTGDVLRFYAPAPGDRWNAADTYWLTLAGSAGRRMTIRGASPAAAPLTTTAVERGVWRQNTLYDSTLPGPDGDHWYAADLRAGPGTASATLEAPVAASLPAAPGTTTLILSGSAYTAGTHQLQVAIAGVSQVVTWSGAGPWTHHLAVAGVGAGAALRLLPAAVPDGVEPDTIRWSRPATLDFGGRGAAFAGLAGTWRYQLGGVGPSATLYDVTDPAAPQLLPLQPGVAPQFQDGPAAREYLLAGAGTLHTPAVQAHPPTDLAAPRAADTVYIAPAALHAALAPLVEHRRAQGRRVALIDVQSIYDAWSYGQVAPAAIRAFLRHAAATWPLAPRWVTLVGDGTVDPHNYSGRGGVNLIPPFMALVDPWLGETACEACYAQLDGDDPRDDLLPDLALGRLPAKDPAELSALVAKLLAHEGAPTDVTWQARALLVADNYRDASGVADTSGDFAWSADQAARLFPAGVGVEKVYYDPWQRDDVGAPRNEPWREPNAARARARTLAAFGAGAGVVAYFGHSHTWQWAVTDPAAAENYLLGLFDPDELANAGRLPVVLEMTCLTAAFQTPSKRGTTIDERLLLAPGGAAAVWGPTGMGVGHGHDALLRGFLRALATAPAASAPVGDLALASLTELFATEACCRDTLRTYALLGDPLTPARLLAPRQTFLPAVGR
jgi:hypothetical protein